MTTATSIARIKECRDCNFEMSISRTTCPHCGRPSMFPNTDIASSAYEVAKLDTSLALAHADCKRRGIEKVAQSFLDKCGQSRAVWACKIGRFFRHIGGETDIFDDFYNLERLERVPSINDTNWSALRSQAEAALFGDVQLIRRQIPLHYASLTLDETGVDSYGECKSVFSEAMIAHRASCFEGNTAVIFRDAHSLDSCLRSTWSRRGELCLATRHTKLCANHNDSDFTEILTTQGVSSDKDEFIEVHITGDVTARTLDCVVINLASIVSDMDQLMLNVVEEKLAKYGIAVIKK